MGLTSHLEWDPRLKWFVAAAYLSKHAMGDGRHEQTAWEDILRSLIARAGGSQPNPFGLVFDAPAVECYPIAVRLAVHWRSIGAPISPDLIDTIGRTSGLIAPEFPQRRAS